MQGGRDRDAFDELCCYTLAHNDPAFIHQHVVDAFTAQTATAATKPIALTFSVAGLYLHVERGLSGRRVQAAHMKMARQKRDWPHFAIPQLRGSITAVDVISEPEGAERDAAIHAWCSEVWRTYEVNRPLLVELLRDLEVMPGPHSEPGISR